MEKNPYEILGVSKSATAEEISKTYKKLAKKYHPDLNPGNKMAEAKFKEINSANQILGDKEERAKYDRGEYEQQQYQQNENAENLGGAGARFRQGPFYYQTQSGGGRYNQSFDEEDLFSSIFGEAFMQQQQQQQQENAGDRFFSGQDVLYKMQIDFQDSILGAEKEITLGDGKRLKVKIPAGIVSGSKLRLSGHGKAGRSSEERGDAYVQVEVRSSPLFTRKGRDVEIDVPLSLSEAILGAEVKVPTVDGFIMLKIPEGASSGMRLRARGKGVRQGGSVQEFGDQFNILKVILPKQIDNDLRVFVQKWQQQHSYDPRSEKWGNL